MRSPKKLNIKKSLADATKPAELKSDLTGMLGAAIAWILPASIAGLSGWAGLGVSFVTTWFAGVALNNKAMRSTAWGLLATQLVYTKGAGVLNSMGIPIWRMQDKALPTGTVNTNTIAASGNGVAGIDPRMLNPGYGYKTLNQSGRRVMAQNATEASNNNNMLPPAASNKRVVERKVDTSISRNSSGSVAGIATRLQSNDKERD